MPVPGTPRPQGRDSRIVHQVLRRRAAEQQLTEAVALLRRLTDDDPCQLDHHGYCQTHSLSEAPCANAEALRLIAKWDEDHPDADAAREQR